MKYNKDKKVKKYFAGGMFLVPAAISAAQAIYGGIQAEKAKQAANKLKMPSTATPDEYAQMMKAAYDSQLMERQLDEINRSMATSVNALQQGGGRALIGGLPAVTRAANQATFEAGQFENQQRLAALGELAGAKDLEMARNMDVYNQQLGMAQAALNAGVQTAAQGVGGVGSALMYGADAFTQKGDKLSMPKIGSKTAKATPTTNPLQLSMATMGGAFGSDEAAMYADEYGNQQRPMFAKNGAMVTGGKFDHKTNPIDIVQKGKKVGEMTGGEVILNPSQANKLSKESAYFRTLLKKFNKK